MIRKLILCLFLLVGGMAASAQCGAVNDAIKPGETLSYELKFKDRKSTRLNSSHII